MEIKSHERSDILQGHTSQWLSGSIFMPAMCHHTEPRDDDDGCFSYVDRYTGKGSKPGSLDLGGTDIFDLIDADLSQCSQLVLVLCCIILSAEQEPPNRPR